MSCQPSRSRAIVDNEVATIVWSRLARNSASIRPDMIVVISEGEKFGSSSTSGRLIGEPGCALRCLNNLGHAHEYEVPSIAKLIWPLRPPGSSLRLALGSRGIVKPMTTDVPLPVWLTLARPLSPRGGAT